MLAALAGGTTHWQYAARVPATVPADAPAWARAAFERATLPMRAASSSGGPSCRWRGPGATPNAGDPLLPGPRLVAGTSFALMQHEGNLVVYGPSGPILNSATYFPGNHLVIQAAGNAVIDTAGGVPVWSTTPYVGEARLVLRGAGNLVVYTSGSVPPWNSFSPTPALIPHLPRPPANPGDSVDCTSFGSWADAYAFYRRYFPYYGDVAVLDNDGDGIPCKELDGSRTDGTRRQRSG